MTICFFGIYNPEYNRNRVLIEGLKRNNINVIQCLSANKGIKKYIDLYRKHKKIKDNYHYLFVAWPGQYTIFLAKLISKKPIIFDVFTSLYDSLVLDRKKIKTKTLEAKYFWIIDWLSCRLGDYLVLDTETHINYFVKKFGIKKEKFIKIFVGADDYFFRNKVIKEKEGEKFFVHFHGDYKPLQGVEYILGAAELLKDEDIEFNIIGNKIYKKFNNQNLKNINFIKSVPYIELVDYLSKADISLGIFGDTEKAKRVIPNKVYESLAIGSPLITGKSEAASEILEDRKNALFCGMADSKSLADRIIELKNNSELRLKIGRQGKELYQKYFTPEKLAGELIKKLK